MWLFPVIAAVLAVAFALLLGRQYVQRRKPYQLAWITALVMYSIASLALAGGVADSWSTTEFRVYWALGAVLNVPFLAAGEIMLLFRRRWVIWASALVLVFLSAYTLSVLRDAAMSAEELREQLPLGKEVFGKEAPAYRMAQYLSYTAYALLLLGTLWSAWTMRGRPELRNRFVGTLLIAVGATVVAAGSAFAAAGVAAGFSLTLACGMAVMFWGFLRASRQVVPAPAASAPPAAG